MSSSKIIWVNYRPFHLSRPEVVMWPGSLIMKKLAQQPFDISEPSRLAKSSDTAVQLLGRPDLRRLVSAEREKVEAADRSSDYDVLYVTVGNPSGWSTTFRRPASWWSVSWPRRKRG